MSFRSLRVGWSIPLLTFFAVLGCGGDGNGGPMDPGPDPTPTISITLSPTTLTLDQGTAAAEQTAPSAGTITVNLTRGGGYTGAVAATLQGAPTGVSASAVTIASGSTSGTLTIEVAATANPGTNNITVQATGSGVSAASATFSLTVNELPQPGFSIALNPASVSLEQGKTTTTNLTVTRTNGFAGEVALVASGVPTGLTVSFNPASVGGDASLVTVVAASGLAVGTYSVTITGSSTGLPDATASLAVEVTASTGGQTVTLTYCDASGIPSWVAVKDGNDPWAPVLPTMPVSGAPTRAAAATYEFQLTSDRAGVATVKESGGSATLEIFFAGASEVWFQGLDYCPGDGVTKTVNGTVAGVGPTEQASITLGGPSATILGASGVFNWTIQNVPDGPVDLLGSLGTLNIGGGGTFTFDLSKLVIQRALNPADNSNIGVVDFTGPDAFAPLTQNLMVNNLGTDAYLANMGYITANGSAGFFFNNFQPSTTATQILGIPDGKRVDTDFHQLSVIATDPNLTTFDRQRSLTKLYKQSADQTVTLGPDLNLPTITQPSVNPYVMFRAQLARQNEYDQYTFVSYSQRTGRQNSVFIGATETYLNGTDFDIMIPNFSGLAGWNDMWGPELGVETDWGVFGLGWSGLGGITGIPVEDGAVNLSAARIGTITP